MCSFVQEIASLAKDCVNGLNCMTNDTSSHLLLA